MNTIGLQELQCFVAVAEELNFSRAAVRLHLSQPPLSRHIQSLETKLGIRLLQRNTRSVMLTPAGRIYLEDVRNILTELAAAGAAARRADAGETSRLCLAFVGALLDEELIGVLRSFQSTHPDCQLHLADLAPAEQLKALREGSLDGGFVGAAPRTLPPKIALVIWKCEPLLLALPSGHARTGRKSLRLSDLHQEPWIMVARSAASAFRHQFDELCAHAGFRPNVVQESERAAAVVTMVAAGQGISLLPQTLERLNYPGVVFRRVKEAKPLLQHAFAYCAKDMSPELSDLTKLLTQNVGEAKLRAP